MRKNETGGILCKNSKKDEALMHSNVKIGTKKLKLRDKAESSIVEYL